jgi:hypothetical protein
MTQWSDHFKNRPELSELYGQIDRLYKGLDGLIKAIEEAEGDPERITKALEMAKIIRKAHNDGEDEL